MMRRRKVNHKSTADRRRLTHRSPLAASKRKLRRRRHVVFCILQH